MQRTGKFMLKIMTDSGLYSNANTKYCRSLGVF